MSAFGGGLGLDADPDDRRFGCLTGDRPEALLVPALKLLPLWARGLRAVRGRAWCLGVLSALLLWLPWVSGRSRPLRRSAVRDMAR